jgi:hypothetical protein
MSQPGAPISPQEQNIAKGLNGIIANPGGWSAINDVDVRNNNGILTADFAVSTDLNNRYRVAIDTNKLSGQKVWPEQEEYGAFIQYNRGPDGNEITNAPIGRADLIDSQTDLNIDKYKKEYSDNFGVDYKPNTFQGHTEAARYTDLVSDMAQKMGAIAAPPAPSPPAPSSPPPQGRDARRLLHGPNGPRRLTLWTLYLVSGESEVKSRAGKYSPRQIAPQNEVETWGGAWFSRSLILGLSEYLKKFVIMSVTRLWQKPPTGAETQDVETGGLPWPAKFSP